MKNKSNLTIVTIIYSTIAYSTNIYQFNKYLLSTSSVKDTVLGTKKYNG